MIIILDTYVLIGYKLFHLFAGRRQPVILNFQLMRGLRQLSYLYFIRLSIQRQMLKLFEPEFAKNYFSWYSSKLVINRFISAA
jgi:hypothetical protein